MRLLRWKLMLGSVLLLTAAGCAHSKGPKARPVDIATVSRLEFGRYVCAPQVRRSPCTSGVRLGVDYWYIMPTHCGVFDAYFAGRLWATRHRLMSTPGNPPRWIDNPMQRGTMRLISARRAEFRARGHTIVFRPAPPGLRSEPCE